MPAPVARPSEAKAISEPSGDHDGLTSIAPEPCVALFVRLMPPVPSALIVWMSAPSAKASLVIAVAAEKAAPGGKAARKGNRRRRHDHEAKNRKSGSPPGANIH